MARGLSLGQDDCAGEENWESGEVNMKQSKQEYVRT